MTIKGYYNACQKSFTESFPEPPCASPSSSSIMSPTSAPASQSTSNEYEKATSSDGLTPFAPLPPASAATSSSLGSCTPRSICADYINSCYMRYGGYVTSFHDQYNTQDVCLSRYCLCCVAILPALTLCYLPISCESPSNAVSSLTRLCAQLLRCQLLRWPYGPYLCDRLSYDDDDC